MSDECPECRRLLSAARLCSKHDPEMQRARKLDAYERAEGLPQKFHVWGLVLDRIKDAAK